MMTATLDWRGSVSASLRVALAAAVLAAAGPAAAQDQAPLSTDNVFRAVVGVRAHVPGDARTAEGLGTERRGTGIVIDSDGLVLTIGYLILEASSVEIISADGREVPAAVVGYDHASGFGLIRAVLPIDASPIRFGDSSALEEGDRALVVSHDGLRPLTPVRVVSRRPYAGYWEYLLENAIFTSPLHRQFGGAGLIGGDGRLLGIGSLQVVASPRTHPLPGNMFVPIDELKPILLDLIENGLPSGPARPWLGVTTNEELGHLFVTRVSRGGPAESAGVGPGDIIVGVGGARVQDMADFYRKVWALGDAGVAVPLDVLPLDGEGVGVRRIEVKSESRYNWLKLEGGL